MNVDRGHISVALAKKGWLSGQLETGSRRGRFVLKVAEMPLKIQQSFAKDLAEGLLETENQKFNIHIDQIQYDAIKKISTFSFDVRLDGDKVMLGDVVLSASGYTGQVEELEDPRSAGGLPNLARVFWYKFRNIEDNFYTWETADNLTILNYPVQGQWWPGINPEMPGHDIPESRPWARHSPGTPIHELVAQRALSAPPLPTPLADAQFRAHLDTEAEMNVCACGCGRQCKGHFAPGHDAKAHRFLRLYQEGKGDPNWKPTSKLLKYVMMHEAWRQEFGDLLGTQSGTR